MYNYVSVFICVVCKYICVWVYVCVSSFVRLRVAAFWTRSCDLNSVTEDSDLCLLWTLYTSDLKIDI